jgi:Na+/alanine symporter
MPVIQLIVGVVVGLAAGMSVGGPGAVIGGVLVAALLGIFMAVKDARVLRATGEPFSSGLAAWCLLGGWAYLLARAIKRVNRTNNDWVLFAVSVVTWLVVIVIATPVIRSAVTSGSVFSRAKVQSDVAQAIYDKTGTSVTVNCPQDPPLNPGSQFQCVATATDGSASMVTITIQDSSGEYTWQIKG